MTKQKKKFYVVWKGKETGVFDSWDDCKRQIQGFTGAQYKSFKTKEAAESAFNEESPSQFLPKGKGDKFGYMMADPILYNLLKNFSSEHRKTPTQSESILWNCLKGGQMDGFHFRRQHIVGKYIADFVCLEKNLVIEIDGLIHQLPVNKESDEERTKWLSEHGLTVLRFKNEEIIFKVEKVLEQIKEKLKVLPFGKDLGWAVGFPVLESISVDAAFDGDVMEYKGVYTKTKKVLFHLGPFEDATNNIGEFLAIVHALGYLKKQNSAASVYSDSLTAITWVKKMHAKTKLVITPANKSLFYLIERAEKWLRENKYPNRLLKWETKAWGENPADFGRK